MVKGTTSLVCLWMARFKIHYSKISEISRKAGALMYIPSTSSGFSSMNHWFHQSGAVKIMQNSQCRSTGGGHLLQCHYHRNKTISILCLAQKIKACLPFGSPDQWQGKDFLQKYFTPTNSSWFSPLHNLWLFINFCFHSSLSSAFQLVCQLERKNIDMLLPYSNSAGAIYGRH